MTGEEGERAEEALRRLEQRLNDASAAAERLLADAAGRVGGAARRPPPAGWQQPRSPSDEPSGSGLGADAELLLGILGAIRDRLPPELAQRLADAVREVLLALRALIDWYLERTAPRATDATQVQDIPIL